ncbi:hypothetical protein SO802_029887 [Lithocarpus litseifolius]|uniref:Uncharacterized protein n=1 Tax=Lithocarpus litseifolius TaxID=425828 RepID=A0AAW2BVG5_9ROSI
MPRNHAYYRWYRPVTRKYVDRNSAKLDIMIEIHLALLEMLPVGSRDHNHVRRVLNNVVGLGGGPAANGQAKNGHETEPATSTIPSTSTTPLSTPSRVRRATTTPSTSAAPLSTPTRGRHATASPSTSAARGRSRPATASPSTSAARGRGRRATTPRVVTSPEIRAPVPHASLQPEVTPPIPDASPQTEVPSPTPPSQPSFDLGVDFHMTPPTHPETPSYFRPTSSSAPTLPIDPPRTEPLTMIPTPCLYTEHHYPPTSSSSDPLRPLVGIETVQPDTDVPDEQPPPQPSPPRGRPQRARRAPTCGTGGHKIGHKGSSMVITMYVVKYKVRTHFLAIRSLYSYFIIVEELNSACSYTIVSIGGTASTMESAGVSVTKVEQLTSFLEMVYLQQELEKLHDLRNKVKSEGELWDDLVSSSSQNSHLVSKATRLWESILARKTTFDVVVVNLYPFYNKVTSTGGIEFEDRIENTDTGIEFEVSPLVSYPFHLSAEPPSAGEAHEGSPVSTVSSCSIKGENMDTHSQADGFARCNPPNLAPSAVADTSSKEAESLAIEKINYRALLQTPYMYLMLVYVNYIMYLKWQLP